MSISLRPPSRAALLEHRWLRRAAIALACLVALWLFTWLAVPYLAKGPIERAASEKLGRAVTVGAIDFKPWSLEVSVQDLVVAGAPAAAGAANAPPQLTIGRIYADGELQSLWRLAPVVDAFTIEAPALRITHLADGRYDVDDILARLAAPTDTPSTGPARLALYNLALTAGQVDFVDNTVGETHEVRGLTLQVPFISTLASQREVKVTPHLAFTLDGSAFDSTAEGTPFAQTGRSDAQVRLTGLNLAPYLSYLPADLPVKVQAALLDADVNVAFEQKPRMAVKLTGTVAVREVRMTDQQGADLLSFDGLKIDMADVRPLEQVVRLAQVQWTGPIVTATRNAAGQINLLQLAPTRTEPARSADPVQVASAAPAATAPTAARPASSAITATPGAGAGGVEPAAQASSAAAPLGTSAAAAAPAAWQVEVASASVRDGTLRWADQTTRPAAQLLARSVTLDATGVVLPLVQPVKFEGGLDLQGSPVRFEGQAGNQTAAITTTVAGLALELAAPYLAQALNPVISGQISGDVGLQWQAPAPDKARSGATGVTVTSTALQLDKFALQQDKTTLARLGQLKIAGLSVPLDGRTATVERVALEQPQLAIERSSDGQWMFERWIAAASTPAPATGNTPTANAPSDAPTAAPPATAPWKWRIADFAVQGGAVSFTDKAQPRAVAVQTSVLSVAARNVASDGSKPEAFQVSARVSAPASPQGPTGKISYKGSITVQPFATEGQLDASQLPLHALDGYLADALAVQLLRAHVGYRGQVAVATALPGADKSAPSGVRLRLSGDAVVEDLQANSTAAFTPKTAAQVGEELLAWKSLNLRGLSVATAPGTAPRVQVKETSLVDFFARVTINEAGRINLSDIAKSPAQAQAANAASANANANASGNANTKSSAGADASTAFTSSTSPIAVASAPAVAAVSPPNPLAPVVVSGPVNLVNGKVLFSDFFIRPNYSADLSELTGTLSAFSSETTGGEPALADLALRGRAEGSASLEITGKLNPLAQPLALDIVGKVRGLELPPLTPYAVKYAGHGIERGKLSVDVNYKILPNGQLTASNRLVLNQLTFGEPVQGAPNSLPVKLAVALLADRNGVIDLDLPISGSLNDPQFRIGPVIFKIIVNLIGKAITAPFALLANALGGGDEMSNVPFAPGSAMLTPEAQQNLGKVVKALVDRPALQITVTGMASLPAEREGLQRERLQQRVLAEKRRTSPSDTSPVQPAEYPALLKAVYARAEIAKPRNLVGLAKELTVAEMEALLLANQPATQAMADELATQRGQAIRAYLVEQKLPVERLFVAAPKTAPQPDPWSPRAELSLGAQ